MLTQNLTFVCFVFSISLLNNKSYRKSNENKISGWKLNFLSNIILPQLSNIRFHLRKFLILKICQGKIIEKFVSSCYLALLLLSDVLSLLVSYSFMPLYSCICCPHFLEWLFFPSLPGKLLPVYLPHSSVSSHSVLPLNPTYLHSSCHVAGAQRMFKNDFTFSVVVVFFTYQSF